MMMMVVVVVVIVVVMEKEEVEEECRAYRTLPVHSISPPWKQHLRKLAFPRTRSFLAHGFQIFSLYLILRGQCFLQKS
jgi:hypothetical protein